MQPFVSGRIVMVEGPKYDLGLVISAHELVLDAIAGRYGPAQLAANPSPKRHRTPWPSPGRAVARLLWEQLAALHDVDSIGIVLLMPGLSVQVRLLGMTWIVQDGETGALSLHDGGDVSCLNPVPVISVFGTYDQERRTYGLLPGDVADEICLLMGRDGRLRDLGLDCSRSTETTHATMATGLTDVVRIFFPHDVYGAGRGPLGVRCTSSSGGDPDPTTFVEN